MSRIGRLPISIPSGVIVELEGDTVKVRGPRGSLEYRVPRGIELSLENGHLRVQRSDDRRQLRALHGLTRTLVSNMVVGVTQGFKKGLEIVGVGYRAEVQGRTLNLNLGYSHPIQYPIPEGITITVDRNVIITVEGIDKQKVGQVAAEIRAFRRPEPYKGKGIRYADEKIRKKVGKGSAGGR